MTTAYISLGGNLGDVPETCRQALTTIGTWPHVMVSACSGMYTTEPVGDRDQPWFFNQVAALTCASYVTPRNLLQDILKLEEQLGRERDPKRRFGPRRIDIDVLLFGTVILKEPDLTLPHPRMTERAFVLVPLLEIAPDSMLPGNGRLDVYLSRCAYRVENNAIYQHTANVSP